MELQAPAQREGMIQKSLITFERRDEREGGKC